MFVKTLESYRPVLASQAGAVFLSIYRGTLSFAAGLVIGHDAESAGSKETL